MTQQDQHMLGFGAGCAPPSFKLHTNKWGVFSDSMNGAYVRNVNLG